MLNGIRWIIWLLGRGILALRYQSRVDGLTAVFKQPGPYLILSNHPAFCDPPNVLVRLWPTFRMRPVLLETNFQNPLLGPFAFLLRAIRVPDTAINSAEVRTRVKEAFESTVNALKSGENVILWPSGRLSRDGSECVGGNRFTADLLVACPDATVVLVRTRGLWGSSYSWADATQPKLIQNLLLGPLYFLSNFLFFMPRRKVVHTLQAFRSPDRPDPNSREALNRWLDQWYNADTPAEVPTFVPYHFLFGPRAHDYPSRVALSGAQAGKVKPETRQFIAELVEEKLKRPLEADEAKPETTFVRLGIDSLDVMEIALRVEQHFGFTGDQVPTKIGDLWEIAEGRTKVGVVKTPPRAWFEPPRGDRPLQILGETVPEAILRRIEQHPNEVAVIDDVSGALTYERLLIGAMILARRFREIPGDHVGLMLPASVGGIVALLALHLAKKVPAILNWTTGRVVLGDSIALLKIQYVLTSKRFVDRLGLEIPEAKPLYLEELRQTIGSFEKVQVALQVKFFLSRTIRKLLSQCEQNRSRPAVVLFTSGSERAPKAVPLTHANVIADLRGALPLLDVTRDDSLVVFLPLFHSFGHTVTGLLPLFTGVRCVYHPDPTDAGTLVRKIAAHKVTATATTPTFLATLLDRAGPEDLKSLRLIVVGAEKCPEALFQRIAQLAPHADVLEGYGITECSPVVSVNPRHASRHGTIGKPLVGVEVSVRDPETFAHVPVGTRGMLLVAGPNIFPGYLGEAPNPFRDEDGKRWYVTGDLAELDPDGYLRFHGRLKRFLKAGGEMISLPALEEPFTQLYPPGETGPRVAVEGIELDGGRRVILFTTESITLKEAGEVLRNAGFAGVMRLDEVRRVESIPVLGTGKTDYKLLRQAISST